MRASLAQPLRRLGYRVHEARTANEALALAAGNQCDLLISELDLSDGDGESLMDALRKRHGMDGIAIGGFVSNERFDAATRAGFCRLAGKPVQVPMLLAAIREMTANRNSIPEGRSDDESDAAA